MKGKPKSKNRKLFDPDFDTARLSQAVTRDLSEPLYDSCLEGGVREFIFEKQKVDLLKKYCSQESNTELLQEEAFAKFKEVNSHMGKVNEALTKRFTNHPIYAVDAADDEQLILLRARALMHSVLDYFDEDEWFLECKNSSGTTVGVPFADTSPERKFKFPLSCTLHTKTLFERYMLYDPKLYSAIEELNGGFPHLGGTYDVRTGSRATTVDKTTTTRRFICIEPTLNMFFQQGLMHLMYKRMCRFGLDVETLPEKHQMLAWIASITGAKATIDFASASDCNAIELIRWLFPPKWFDTIMLLRCPTTLCGEGIEQLNMISSMGNAVTFPLESLVFWTLAQATVHTKNGMKGTFISQDKLSDVSVFGDDCILPTQHASAFMDIAEKVGFIVNKEKSFYGTERFRESCGGDYLQGYPVRPFHLKAPPNTKASSREPWLYTTFNALIKKYILYFGELEYMYDKDLFRLMSQLFVECEINIKLVPNHFPDDAGLKIAFDLERFCRHYDLRLERIDKSAHGTLIFKYCRFRYRGGAVRDDNLRYNMWLKKPRLTEGTLEGLSRKRKPKWDRPNRKVGGYVVAKGSTCHWHVPPVRGTRE